MDDRAFGRLEGKVDAIHADLADIKKDVKALQNFKWRVAGGAAVLSFILTSAIELIRSWRG